MNNHAIAWTELIHARDITYMGLFLAVLVAYVIYRQVAWRIFKLVVAGAGLTLLAGVVVGVVWASSGA